MGIRETLNENPGITTGITAGIIVLALGVIIWQTVGNNYPPTPIARAFFSDDDGKTFFADSTDNIPPFDHNGKQAVKAVVFTCDNGKTKFVGYLERFSPAAKAKLQAAMDANRPDLGLMESTTEHDVQVKQVNGGQWYDQNSPQGQQIMNDVKCKNGSKDGLSIAVPE